MKTYLLNSPARRLLLAGLLLPLVATCGMSADVVTDWNATYEAAVRNPTLSPPVLARSAAIVHVAIFDAVNGIAKKYTPVHVTDAAPVGARALRAFGLSNPVADPSVTLFDSTGAIIAQNDNWSSGGATNTAALNAATLKTGAFVLGANSLDAALLTTLAPGAYTIHVHAAAGAGGVALIEAYEVP